MKTLVHRYWKYAAIVIAFLFAAQTYNYFSIKKTLRDIYYYDIEITLVDKETGDLIQGKSVGGPGSSSADVFQQPSGISMLGNGRIRLSGAAYESRSWSIGSEGYQKSEIEIDKDSPHQMRVELTKK
jgi:hypothetical protein